MVGNEQHTLPAKGLTYYYSNTPGKTPVRDSLCLLAERDFRLVLVNKCYGQEAMSMLVFLDFDGVLHALAGEQPFQSRCMAPLASALAPFDVEIVIASSWRELAEFSAMLDILAPLDKPVVGTTPIIDDPFLKYIRHHEVLEYLGHTNQTERRWIGIDDTRGFYPSTAPVYWTNPMLGFVPADIAPLQQLIRHRLVEHHP